jgi:heme-degrading monooxygenase HmoA
MPDTFDSFIRTLKRPFYAVIFQTPQTAGYPHWGQMTESMVEFAAAQPGFLGFETSGPVNGFTTSMTFWSSEEAIKSWEEKMDNKPTGYKILISKAEDVYDKKPVA